MRSDLRNALLSFLQGGSPAASFASIGGVSHLFLSAGVITFENVEVRALPLIKNKRSFVYVFF